MYSFEIFISSLVFCKVMCDKQGKSYEESNNEEKSESL